MGVKVSGIESLLLNLRQIGEYAVKGVSDEIRRGAYGIRNLAREYAPVDEGNLEEALSIEINRDDINRRLQAFVYIDMTKAAKKSITGDVGGYAMRMHEGFYKLGAKSRVKDGGRNRVGRKFLQRAADELSEEIMARVQAKIARYLR